MSDGMDGRSNDPAQAPALIGVDWGSSNLRVALLARDGAVLARRESPEGVFALADGDFSAVLWRACGDWFERHGLPMLACGMIGSRSGIVEVPYLPCPAGVDELAGALARVELSPTGAARRDRPVAMHIVPGLKCGSDATGWDVIRGEETQLLGVANVAGRVFVLPGTHSKWMTRSNDGRIATFQTYMTGELFDLLVRHGSPGRVIANSRWSPGAFERGVREARDGRLEDLLFRVRTAGLMGMIDADALADYLSGMLIGAELAAGLARSGAPSTDHPPVVIGAETLVRRYATAMGVFGLEARGFAGDAVFGGLALLAARAGLLPAR